MGSSGCWGPCPVEFWVSSRMQIPKLLWAPFPVFLKVFFFFLFSPSTNWLALPLFPLGSVASHAVAVHLHEGSTLALRSWWQQEDLPWASCFPGWTFSALSASPRTSGAPAPLTILVASPELTPVCPCLLRWEAQAPTQHSRCGLSGVRWEGSLHHFCYSSPGHCWPPLPQGRIADSCSTWCPPAH